MLMNLFGDKSVKIVTLKRDTVKKKRERENEREEQGQEQEQKQGLELESDHEGEEIAYFRISSLANDAMA